MFVGEDWESFLTAVSSKNSRLLGKKNPQNTICRRAMNDGTAGDKMLSLSSGSLAPLLESSSFLFHADFVTGQDNAEVSPSF